MRTSTVQFTLLFGIFVTIEISGLQGERALSARKYHEILQNLAVIHEIVANNNRSDVERKELLHRFNLRESGRRFYKPTNLEIHGDTKCPSRAEILKKRHFRVCPAYYVTEYDPYRIPAIVFQVRCKCVSCHGPDYGHNHKCSPLFKFINAYRVIDTTQSGDYVYGKVREPISYGCQCKKDSFGLRPVYVPP